MASSGFKKFDPHAWLKKEGHKSDGNTSPKSDLAALAVLAGVQMPNLKLKEETKNEHSFLDFSFRDEAAGCENNIWTPAKTAKAAKTDTSVPIDEVFSYLERHRSEYIEQDRWRQAVEDGEQFLATWGTQAAALGWTGIELFGLHEPPANPHPSYNRLSRYDCTGLVWLLAGNPVVALTDDTAAIQHRTGAITIYRKLRKPGYGPLGDSLDDFR